MEAEPESEIEVEAEVESDWVDFESAFEDYDCSPPLKIRKEVVDQCYQKANSKANLAVQLIKRSYSRKERATSNCAGDHRYKKKNSRHSVCRQSWMLSFLSTQSGQGRKKKTTGKHIGLQLTAAVCS